MSDGVDSLAFDKSHELDFAAAKASAQQAREASAGIAQRLEQLTCNQQVLGSIPSAGSI